MLMLPLFNCSNSSAATSITALVVSSLVFTSEPQLPCPPSTASRTEIGEMANVSNCTLKCQTDYELAQLIAEHWASEAVPPALLKRVAVGLAFTDIVLLLLCTAVVGLIFFAVIPKK